RPQYFFTASETALISSSRRRLSASVKVLWLMFVLARALVRSSLAILVRLGKQGQGAVGEYRAVAAVRPLDVEEQLPVVQGARVAPGQGHREHPARGGGEHDPGAPRGFGDQGGGVVRAPSDAELEGPA